MRLASRLSALLLSVWLAWVTPVVAQTAATGALVGTITDPAGAVIPSVDVVLTNVDIGQERSTTTGPDGTYRFSLLLPGTYRIKFMAKGFKSAEVGGVKVNVTETPTLNRSLEIGAQTDQVTVEANTETVQTSNATLGTVVGQQAVTGLPLSTRNYTQILGLSAGVVANVNNASQFGNGSQNVSVNGSSVSQNNFQMDGVSVVNFTNNNNADQGCCASFGVPNPDALQEFKIQTSLYDAGYGRNPGASVNVVTKSGTNQFHGGVFEFFRNTALNANDFFRNRSGGSKQVLNQNQFGGTLGGPIKKDKLFFFFSQQETRQINGIAAQGFQSGFVLPPIPLGDRSNTAAFRSALGTAMCPGTHPGDARYLTQFGGVQVACDGSNINPVAINMLQLKLPNGNYLIPSSSNGLFQSGATFSIPARYSEHQTLINSDYLISSKHSLATRYFYTKRPTSLPFSTAAANAPILPGGGAENDFGNHEAVLKLTSILTNSLVNEARASYQRNVTAEFPLADFAALTNAQIGLPSIQQSFPGLSKIVVAGQFTNTGNVFDTEFVVTNQTQFADTLSWSRGRQTIRFGGEYERIALNWTFPSLSRGALNFQTFPDLLLGLAGCAPGNTTCSAANPGNTNGTPFSNIFGTQVFSDRTSPSGLVNGWRATDANLFLQDDIKINKRLTVNLGVRWEFDGLVNDKYGNLSGLWLSQVRTVPIPGTSAATGSLAGWIVPSNFQGSVPPGVLRVSRDTSTQNGAPLNNFAPRLGFAWQPFGTNRFVVRGGGGFFYDRTTVLSVIQTSNQSPPYAQNIAKTAQANVNSSYQNPWDPTPLGTYPVRFVNFNTGVSSNLTASFLDENWRTPLVYSYNMSFQYEFLPKWLLEVGYVGSHGIHQLIAGWLPNAAGLASVSNPINGITANTTSNVAFRVPYLGFAANGLAANVENGDFKYNSLQTTLRKQLSHGLQLQAAYTLSRAFSTGTLISNSPNDFRQQYGLNPAYRPQRLVLSYLLNLPFGNHKGFAGRLVTGWSLSGVTTIQSGDPLTLVDTRGGTIFGAGNSRAQICAGSTYGDLVTSGALDTRLGGASGGLGYFNKTAICPPPVIGNGTAYGNTGVGVAFGPGQFNFDSSLVKNTTVGGIREGAVLQFRAEFFNVFNHAQFSDPAVSVSAANFGLIAGTSVNPRLIQLALKYSF